MINVLSLKLFESIFQRKINTNIINRCQKKRYYNNGISCDSWNANKIPNSDSKPQRPRPFDSSLFCPHGSLTVDARK